MLGCTSPQADEIAAKPHSTPTPQASHTEAAKTVTLVGLLTRKGPDMDSWWALTGDDGAVWKLEPSDANQVAQFQRWQNSRTRIKGVTAGFMLTTPILRVERIELLQ